MLLYIHAGHKLTALVRSPRQAVYFSVGGRALFPQLIVLTPGSGSDLVSTAGGSDSVSISGAGFYHAPTISTGGLA